MSDHERIWLQAAEDAAEYGRLWSQDKVWPDHPDDSEPTEYVRADLVSQARAEGRREGLEEAAKVADEVAQNYKIKTDRQRFSESDVNRYMRGLVRMTSEDIRALAQKEGGKDG